MTGEKVNSFSVYRKAASIVLKSRHFWHLFILGVLLIYCILFYYLGELVDLLRWETLRIDFFYSAHDVQRVFFLAPIIYAGYIFGRRAAIIVTLVSALAILVRIMIAPESPDPIWRIIMFIVVAGAVGYITARLRRSHLPSQNKGSGAPRHS
jgi:hypothetical protein